MCQRTSDASYEHLAKCVTVTETHKMRTMLHAEVRYSSLSMSLLSSVLCSSWGHFSRRTTKHYGNRHNVIRNYDQTSQKAYMKTDRLII